MRPLDLAIAYMEVFFSGEDLDRLYGLCAPDLVFEGPFLSSDTAAAYVEALKADPPVGCSYEILRAFESGASACLIYRFTKPGVSTRMAQVFDIEGDRICRMLLLFDPGAFG